MTVASTIDDAQMDKVLCGIQIPAQPRALIEIQDELRLPAPDIKRVSSIVSKDVGLSAAVLKTINSPFYGLRTKVESIQRAAVLFGLPNISNLVRGIALRQTMSKVSTGLELDHFWDHASEVANIAIFLAIKFRFENPDEYYSLGLFHDAGIAILAQKFDDYHEILREGNSMFGGNMVFAEDAKYQTNHAIIGYYLARSWNLSDSLAQAVLHHHNADNLLPDRAEHLLRNQMLAVLKLASHISHAHSALGEDGEWEKIAPAVLAFLNLSPTGYSDLCEEVATLLR